MRPLPAADRRLVQIVDAALADATRRSGHWLVCRPGCTQCCIGVFAINQLDALRLQHGLADLQRTDPARAARVRERVDESASRLACNFPGDPGTGVLRRDAESLARFEDFANDEPCPALDPATGLCDLYSSRPLTCRSFGPPVHTQGGLGICELCFQGASEREIAACELQVDPDGLESKILRRIGSNPDEPVQTIVTFALSASLNRGKV
ncbi:MAG: YkgJ family cysteine cluster protein [Terriglobia bacterium]|jgi:Fe-S-cluster containining protein|nr:YkgJ family cysteine cluster protein [Terriglobia bacterium]